MEMAANIVDRLRVDAGGPWVRSLLATECCLDLQSQFHVRRPGPGSPTGRRDGSWVVLSAVRQVNQTGEGGVGPIEVGSRHQDDLVLASGSPSSPSLWWSIQRTVASTESVLDDQRPVGRIPDGTEAPVAGTHRYPDLPAGEAASVDGAAGREQIDAHADAVDSQPGLDLEAQAGDLPGAIYLRGAPIGTTPTSDTQAAGPALRGDGARTGAPPTTEERAASSWRAQVGVAHSALDTARRLGRTEQEIADDPRLLGVPQPTGQVAYPVFQFEGTQPRADVGELVQVLRTVFDPATIAGWLTTQRADLAGRTPLAALDDPATAGRVRLLAHRVASSQ